MSGRSNVKEICGVYCFAWVDVLFVMLRLSRCPPTRQMVFTWLPLMMSLVMTNSVLWFLTGCLQWDLGLNCISF